MSEKQYWFSGALEDQKWIEENELYTEELLALKRDLENKMMSDGESDELLREMVVICSQIGGCSLNEEFFKEAVNFGERIKEQVFADKVSIIDNRRCLSRFGDDTKFKKSIIRDIYLELSNYLDMPYNKDTYESFCTLYDCLGELLYSIGRYGDGKIIRLASNIMLLNQEDINKYYTIRDTCDNLYKEYQSKKLEDIHQNM